jgi:hypothetical protein
VQVLNVNNQPLVRIELTARNPAISGGDQQLYITIVELLSFPVLRDQHRYAHCRLVQYKGVRETQQGQAGYTFGKIFVVGNTFHCTMLPWLGK